MRLLLLAALVGCHREPRAPATSAAVASRVTADRAPARQVAAPALPPEPAAQAEAAPPALEAAPPPDDTVNLDTAPPTSAMSAVIGRVLDQRTREPLAGVTVIVSTDDRGETAGISDENGLYRVDAAPGAVHVFFYYADAEASFAYALSPGALVNIDEDLDTSRPRQPIVISTHEEIVFDETYTVNIPVPGRTFEAALGAAAGSQEDSLGLSFSSADTLEDTYIVGDE